MAIPSERHSQLCHSRLGEDAACPGAVAPILPEPESDELFVEEFVEKLGPPDITIAARMSTSVPFHFTALGLRHRLLMTSNGHHFPREEVIMHLVGANFAESLLIVYSLSKLLPPSLNHNAIIIESQPFRTPFSTTLLSQWNIGVFVLDSMSLFAFEGRIA